MTAVPAILIALLMQAILFQYGGLSSLGVNTVITGLPAVLSHYIFMRAKSKRSTKNRPHQSPYVFAFIFRCLRNNSLCLLAFFCGSFAVIISALLLGLTLALSGDEFILVAKLAVASHIPVMIVEGIITASCILFLKKVKPEAIGL